MILIFDATPTIANCMYNFRSAPLSSSDTIRQSLRHCLLAPRFATIFVDTRRAIVLACRPASVLLGTGQDPGPHEAITSSTAAQISRAPTRSRIYPHPRGLKFHTRAGTRNRILTLHGLNPTVRNYTPPKPHSHS